MTESELTPMAVQESRVDRIERIINSLSDFEQDELKFTLNVAQMQDYGRRIKQGRNALAFGLHTMVMSGGFFGISMGVFAGIVMGLHAGPVAGISTFFWTALGAGTAFGLFMAVYLWGIMCFVYPRMAGNIHKRKSAAFQVEEVQLPVPVPEALEACLSVLSARKGTRIELVDRDNASVRATTAMSWRSPGEIVGVKIDPLGSDSARVRVYSKAMFTALDLGKNRSNVAVLCKAIQEAGEVHALLKSASGS